MFFICSHCDRGHRYCSHSCRFRTRLAQRREARRRHQRSLEGRLDHRDRQLRTIGVNNAKTTPEAQSGMARRVSRDLKIPFVYL